jgi:hypothetical protein
MPPAAPFIRPRFAVYVYEIPYWMHAHLVRSVNDARTACVHAGNLGNRRRRPARDKGTVGLEPQAVDQDRIGILEPGLAGDHLETVQSLGQTD